MHFSDFKLHPALLQSITEEKYDKPTPIQEKAFPPILSGKDVLACAQTGTGKTAAFAIPILHLLSKSLNSRNSEYFHRIKALVLAPTRELAIQIGESFQRYGRHLELSTGVVYGGVTPKRHIKVLKREPDLLIATPGRLLDLIGQGYVDLSEVKIMVLDEADRMLDLGMIHDVKSILNRLPKERQTLLFSATIPNEIAALTKTLLKNPVKIQDQSKSHAKKEIAQQVYYVEAPDKSKLLMQILKEEKYESVLVFVKTKTKADQICKTLNINNIRSKAIHGDKNQSERLKALELFKNKEIRVLVATDVAARGLDIHRLSLVINMDIPSVPENYTHRIGRTGRAQSIGKAISFCSSQEMDSLKTIEAHQGVSIKVVHGHPFEPLRFVLERNRKR
ncbi:MAG: DEAD/DEAH box helicase [Vallitaleaceae bacterium]|nr:DEAD/DEAH box helicase [Vallitaleaceae bacterium]